MNVSVTNHSHIENATKTVKDGPAVAEKVKWF